MIKEKDFGILSNGCHSKQYILTNGNGMEVSVCDVGASVVSILVPAEDGTKVDVALGHESAAEYETQMSNMGAIVGRHAGRLGNAAIHLNNRRYELCSNSGNNHIHGGIQGFAKKQWDAKAEGDSIIFHYISSDGEGGYPGEVEVLVSYRLDDENRLHIGYYAVTRYCDTILNLTNHTYFNLKGHDAGNAAEQVLQLYADYFTAIDEAKKPIGSIIPVYHTPLDFRNPKPICQGINSCYEQIRWAGGFDHNYVLHKTKRNALELAACLQDPVSGRSMDVYTTLPGIQLYSGNHLNGNEKGKNHIFYPYRAGICLEAQLFPNAMECTHFPSPILHEGEQYRHTTIYKFYF